MELPYIRLGKQLTLNEIYMQILNAKFAITDFGESVCPAVFFSMKVWGKGKIKAVKKFLL